MRARRRRIPREAAPQLQVCGCFQGQLGAGNDGAEQKVKRDASPDHRSFERPTGAEPEYDEGDDRPDMLADQPDRQQILPVERLTPIDSPRRLAGEEEEANEGPREEIPGANPQEPAWRPVRHRLPIDSCRDELTMLDSTDALRPGNIGNAVIVTRTSTLAVFF